VSVAKRTTDLLTIGELAARSGLATSALRFYEAERLIHATRTEAGHRRYTRSTLRRVAFVRAAREIGLSLEEIHASLATLPADRTPTRADWARLSRQWRVHLERRIRYLERLRDDLTSCIGCGCLSLANCRLQNPADKASVDGAGARYLRADAPDD
jgi:MerR family transcriptional regulator, redox-sensitive transcriptional activator SoxR